MRIADRHGRPLSEVLSDYPAWELPFWASWYSHELSDGHRTEIAVARLTRNFIAANSKKGHQPPDLEDLVIGDWWAEKNRESALRADDDAITRAFRQAGFRVVVNDPKER